MNDWSAKTRTQYHETTGRREALRLLQKRRVQQENEGELEKRDPERGLSYRSSR